MFLLADKIVENSGKLSDFENKGAFKLGDDRAPSSGFKRMS